MSSLANLHLQSNTQIKINFNGGNLSSDAGLLLLHEFVDSSPYLHRDQYGTVAAGISKVLLQSRSDGKFHQGIQK